MLQNFHDAELLGIEKNDKNDFIIKLLLQNNIKNIITFKNAVWWKLSSFENENILEDKILEYKKSDIPNDIIKFLEKNINKDFIEFIIKGDFNVYCINALKGCDGIIIASEIIYENCD